MSHIAQVAAQLLQPTGLDEQKLSQVISQIMGGDIDYADLFFQSSRHESWVLEDGIVKDGSFNIECGVGVRALAGEKTGFSYADTLTLDALTLAGKAARSICQQGKSGVAPVALRSQPVTALYSADDPLASMSAQDKVQLLQQVDRFTRALDPQVKEVIVSLSAVYEQVLVAASDGTFAADIRPLVRFNCSVLMEANGKRERASAGGGGRHGFGFLLELENGEPYAYSFAREAVRQARVNLEAIDAPAGMMPVVLGAGWPGVLLHEAVGHGLEGDFNRKGSSTFSGRVGEQVASSLCTVVDDGTLLNRRGSVSIDDEGVAGAYNVLIENGVLKGYLQDKQNARLMGVAPTGNGRRESYAHVPMPRMTNTYMLPGQSDPQEIIASVKRGLYAPNFGGGQVDITSGKFVFSASEAYLIEDGKITAPVKGATLIGNGPEVMSMISMVGNDLALDKGVGVCGKDGQSVPVGVGQPTLKIDQLTVGGTA